MDISEENIPISVPDRNGPFLDEESESEILEGDVGDLSEEEREAAEGGEEMGSYNELPDLSEAERSSIDIGDSLIMLMKGAKEPFLGKVTEISSEENILIMVDDKDRTLTYVFENGELLKLTLNYEILDYIKVRPYDPIKEKDEYQEIELETEVLVDKIYSELAIKDDLLSTLIISMNIYDNPLLIERVQETIDTLLELYSNLGKSEKKYLPKYMIPIIGDEIKKYDELGYSLSEEIKQNALESEAGYPTYRDYINSQLKHSKPILTTNGYGFETDEYYDTYLRNCIQDENCAGLMGAYRYDERRNNSPIYFDDAMLLPANRLRFIALLEEPYNETVYSLKWSTLQNFNVFEKYIYDSYYRRIIARKRLIKDSYIVTTDGDEYEPKEKDKYIIYNLNHTTDNDYLYGIYDYNVGESIKALLNDDVSVNLYNYTDIEKILFKFGKSFTELDLNLRNRITDLLKINIERYHKRYVSIHKRKRSEVFKPRNIELSDEMKCKICHEKIFQISKPSVRNHYLQKYIDIYTRVADKVTESPDYLYNVFTNEKSLCKHYLFMVNISNDNDLFDTMKSKYGAPPEDGMITCKICGGYLCNEDTTLIDGYNDDKPMVTREVIDTEKDKKLEVSEYLDEKIEYVNMIKMISESVGINMTDEDIYEILLSFELLDNNILADERYGLMNVSTTDIHPRINIETQKIKKLETKTKDKNEKKRLKVERENVFKTFQRWLKDSNNLLMLTALVALTIQCRVPSYFSKDKRSLDVIDVDNHKIDNGVVNYYCAKLRRLYEEYSDEKRWKCVAYLINEKEYKTNTFETQLGLTIKYCMEPTFPLIINRISNYEECLGALKHDYLKKEWPMFRPLQKNTLVVGVNKYLDSINDGNFPYFRKVYGGYLVTNNTMLRPLTYPKEISELLKIPEVGIFKNSSFRLIFRYVVALYGKHKSNLILTLSFNRMLETCDKPDEILRILNRNGWNESSNSFKELDFQVLRKRVIPDILALYGDKNTVINSCFNNEKACNSFIHNAINTYDLPLLNTKPKRIYYYKPPTVYPELPFERLKESKAGKTMVDRLFKIYKRNDMDEIVKYAEDNFYDSFLAKTILYDKEIKITKDVYKNIESNSDNFYRVLETIRSNTSLPQTNYINRKIEYKSEDYDIVDKYANLDSRFQYYLYIARYEINERLKDIFTRLPEMKEELIIPQLKTIFSDIMDETSTNIGNISKFLARSDDLEDNQKRRFESIFKEYNPSERIKFSSDQLIKIINLFINDTNLRYHHLLSYMNDMRIIFSHLCVQHNKEDEKITSSRAYRLEKRWKVTQSVESGFLNFLNRDNNSVNLLLHNRIFVKTKDNYIGFNRYLNENQENVQYFQFLFNRLKPRFMNLEMIKGSNSSYYNERYSDIYMKYNFIGLLNDIVNIIQELKDEQSEVTSDANDLFQSLEQRDEDNINDMIELYSQFLLDLLTHVFFEHYDPSWLFLNEQKLDLANRLSKQKEREKQEIINRLDDATREERFAIMQKNKMGISLFYKQATEKASEYVNSDEHVAHTEDERIERLQQIMSDANVELDTVTGEVNEAPPVPLIDPSDPNEGYVDYEEYDPEDETYADERLDDEQEAIFNE
jgi:hypothetical protein